MQIILNLDESLLNEAFQLTELTTQDDLIKLALQELVRLRRKKNLLVMKEEDYRELGMKAQGHIIKFRETIKK